MKKFCVCICTLVLALGTLTGCGLFGNSESKPKFKEIGTYEELIALTGNDSAKLTADIDCDYDTLPHMIYCKNFDGDGHTIKNFTVNQTSVKYAALFDIHSTESIKNLTVENATVKCASGFGAAVIVAGGSNCKSIENVHVQKATVQIKQSQRGGGGFMASAYQDCYVAGIYAGKTNYESGEKYDCDIKDCSVDDLTFNLEAVELDTASGNTTDIYGGGIAGRCHSISGCSVTNSNMTLKSASTTNKPYLGGLAATVDGSVENSYVKDCELTVKATWYYKTTSFSTDSFYTSSGYLGGLVSNKEYGSIHNSYVQDCTLKLNSSGSARLGGIVGYAGSMSFVNVYAVGNTVQGGSLKKENTYEYTRNIGGMFGTMSGCSLTSCFAYDNTVTDDADSSSKSKVCGIAGYAGDSVLTYCAFYNTVSGGSSSSTVTSLSGITPTECYLTGSETSGFEALEASEWLGEGLKEKLNLLGEQWQFSDESAPSLNI